MYNQLVSRASEGKYSGLGKFRILSVDIECSGRKVCAQRMWVHRDPLTRLARKQGHFPDAKLDSVIQIASYVTVHGERKPIIKNVMTLGGCAPIVGAEVMSFSSERDLLLAWKKFMVATDPDWLIGAYVSLLHTACTRVATHIASFGRIQHHQLRLSIPH